MNEDIIDYGEITLPTSWDELSLKTYQEIDRYYDDKEKKFDIREVLHIFSNKTIDEINQMPLEFVDKLLEHLAWIEKQPQWGEPTNKIEISGETYIINIQDKLKTGEFIATDTTLKADPHNYAGLLAVLCRKEGELYDSKFENEILEDRIHMWEEQSITKVMPLVAFFLQCYIVSKVPSQLSSELDTALDHIQKNIENSDKIGVFKRHYLTWRIKTLRKSLKSIKST